MTHSNTDREMTATSPTYDMAMTDGDNKAVPEKNEGLYAECSMTTLDNTYAALDQTELQQETEQVYMNAGNTARKTASKATKKQRFDVTSCKALACIFTSIAAMAAIIIICIACFSVEIAKLNAKTASIQLSPFGQPAEVMQADILRRLNSSIDTIYSLLDNKTNQLNSSVDTIYSLLDNRINQLNSSINHLHQQIKSVIENNTLELDITNFALQNYTSEVNFALASQLNSTEMIYQRLSQNISVLEYRADQVLKLHSCAALLPTTPSGYYWVSASNGSAVRVYCDMTRSCGGVTGGWVRVGYLDMTDSSHQCPSGFTEHNDSNIRTCRREDTSAGCGSVMMGVPYQYSRVCGRVRAYQVGSTNAFRLRTTASIDSTYVDGVSLTHGRPRQHIWTFAAALQEDAGNHYRHPSLCPCNTMQDSQLPPFVRNDYFCESGTESFVGNFLQVYNADPLWDGAGCEGINNCCSFNTPPWFHKQLSTLTADDIEMRVCTDENAMNENVYIEMVEIYVQ